MEVGFKLYASTALSLEKNFRAYLIGGWMGHRTDLNVLEREKTLAPAEI
jgi:hypothetical protein